MKRALALDDIRTRVVQAETGGGFGGKEEYPSIIAIHAALLARACRKPVRMIYDRHEDISATTKRHPAVVTHRTGMRRDGTLVAQDIEVVMDGGAYCTLTPVVLSRGALHAGGPYRCPNVRIRSRATRTNTPPNGAFRGFGAPQTEFAAETHLNRLAEAVGLSPLEIRRRNVYVLGDTTPTGQVLRHSVAGEEVLERAAEAAEFERMRERTTEARSAPSERALPDRAGTPRAGSRHRARLARRRVHRVGRGEARLGRGGRADRRRPDRDPDRLDRDGAGDQDDLPAARRRRPRRRVRRRGDRPAGHRARARLRPDRCLADRDGRRWAADHGVAPAARDRRSGDRPVVRRELSRLRLGERTAARRPAVRAVSRRVVRRRDVPGRRLPGLRLGVVRGARRGGPRHGRGVRARCRRRGRRRQGHPPGAGRGPGGGGHAAGGRLRHDRGDEGPRRPLRERPARDLPHPDRARRATHHLDPRRGAVPRRPAHGEGRRRAADGCRRARGRRRDPRRDRRVDPRPAGDAREDPRGAPRARGWSERSRDATATEAAIEAVVEAPIEGGPDPRPDAPTDPLPLRGVQPDGDEPTGEGPSDRPWDGQAR